MYSYVEKQPITDPKLKHLGDSNLVKWFIEGVWENRKYVVDKYISIYTAPARKWNIFIYSADAIYPIHAF